MQEEAIWFIGDNSDNNMGVAFCSGSFILYQLIERNFP